MNITVVALGKIGLPLAVQFAKRGHTVVGADVNKDLVETVNSGQAPFPGEAYLEEYLAEVTGPEAGTGGLGSLRATTETTEAVRTSEAVVVVVPLFVDGEGTPQFGWMDAATEAIAAGLQPGTLISYETTLPVGTTRNRFAPMLEQGSGLTAGQGFHLVFSPERVFTGRVFADLRKYPKLVGGIDAESGKRGQAFYESVLTFDERADLVRPNGVWDLGGAEAAELAKLAETTYRDVNIGLANQFARFAAENGIDVHQVIEASNSQPFSHIHRPGMAVGGHCIPVYPRLYLWGDPGASVVRAAREVNAGMPVYTVGLLEGVHGDLRDQRVVVLGASYRGGVKETAFSGVFAAAEALRERGAEVSVTDPMFTAAELEALGLPAHAPGTPVDAAILHTDHAAFRELTAADLPGVRTVIDGRGTLDPAAWPGVTLRAIGRG